MKLAGSGGTIELTDTHVILEKRTLDTSQGTLMALFQYAANKPSFSIPLDSIIAVQLSPGGMMSMPFIQILTAGESAVANVDQAGRVPSALVFARSDRAAFNELKEKIEKKVAALKRRGTQAATISVADELAKLAKLRDGGILSVAEFDAQKKKLLGL